MKHKMWIHEIGNTHFGAGFTSNYMSRGSISESRQPFLSKRSDILDAILTKFYYNGYSFLFSGNDCPGMYFKSLKIIWHNCEKRPEYAKFIKDLSLTEDQLKYLEEEPISFHVNVHVKKVKIFTPLSDIWLDLRRGCSGFLSHTENDNLLRVISDTLSKDADLLEGDARGKYKVNKAHVD